MSHVRVNSAIYDGMMSDTCAQARCLGFEPGRSRGL